MERQVCDCFYFSWLRRRRSIEIDNFQTLIKIAWISRKNMKFSHFVELVKENKQMD